MRLRNDNNEGKKKMYKSTRDKEQAQREELQARWNEFEAKLVEALKNAGHEVEVQMVGDGKDIARLKGVNGRRVQLENRLERDGSHSYSMYSNYTGRLRYVVENEHWDKSTSYPEPKKGFCLKQGVERVLAMVKKAEETDAARTRRNNDEVERKATFDRAMELIGEGGKEHYGIHYHKTSTIKACSAAKVKLECYVTPEKLAELLELL